MSRLDHRFPTMGTQGLLSLGDRTPGETPSPELRAAAADALALLADLEARWSRFRPDSDLSLLTDDPRATIPAHETVRALVRAGAWAGRRTRGLVDITLGAEMAAAGYAGDWRPERALALEAALAAAPARRGAGPHPDRRWRALATDDRRGTITRPPDVVLDSGGIGKGLAAHLVARRLRGLRYVVDLGGDLALGAGGGEPHEVAVEHPLTGGVAHVLRVRNGGVATSGIHRRIWAGSGAEPAHHVLDPATGRPAWTGLLTATAIGRTALEAEVLATTALLAGPRRGRGILAELGGVLIAEDGRVDVIAPLRRLAAEALRDLALRPAAAA